MDFFVSETWGIAEILKYIEKKLLVKDAPSGTCMNIVYWGQTGFFWDRLKSEWIYYSSCK